jgi:hypothetical protein
MTSLTTFVAIAAIALASADPVWKEVCHNHCHIDGAPEFHNALEDSCGPYRHVLPKPKVFNFCKKGFEESLTTVCNNMCTTKTHSKTTNTHAQFCKQYKREMPKPGAWESCKHGHGAGQAVAHAWAHAKLQEYNSLKAATGASDQVIEEVMEKEAEIEEEIAKEATGKISKAQAKKEFEEIEKRDKVSEKAKDELELARQAARAAFDSQEADAGADGDDAEEESDSENATEIDL